MKLLFAAGTALSLLITGLVGLNSAPAPTVTSIRAFEEPLVAIGGDKSANQDAALIAALQAYQHRKSFEDVSAITTYLDTNPQSPWKFSLLANLGIVYRRTGHFSRALDVWEQAWSLGKGEKKVQVQALANRVASELSLLLSSLGRTERLDSLLKETKGRTVYGSASAALMTTKENLWLMKNRPEESFKCGPYALDSIRTFADKKDAYDKLVRGAKSSTKGFSLTQVRDLSNQLKMNYQIAKRQPGADFIIPSVAHWKSGHYAALLKKAGDHYLTKDPTFGQEILVTAQALEDESSGYFLVPSGALPSGWQAVSDTEGNTVWGRGVVPSRVDTASKPNDKKPCPGGSSNGMAVYSIFAMLVSLSIEDTPVGYTPPVGPDMHFSVTYNQLEANQPGGFSYFNFGPSWNCAWLSYVTAPTSSGGSTMVHIRGGGQEIYTNYTSTGTTYPGYVGYYGFELQSQAALWVTTSGTFERRLPDGSKEVFGQVDPSGIVFLTAIVDPKNNSVSLSYDSSFRLITVTDPAGLQTTMTYGLSGDSLKITKITDPYNRSATFGYTSYSGTYQLTSITDVVGITSSFTYGTGSAITEMTTPYGNTMFNFSVADTTGSYTTTSPGIRSLNVLEPDGSQVQAESHIDGSNYPYGDSDPSNQVPSGPGIQFFNINLTYRNTFYWDKKAMHDAPGDYTKCHIYHFLHTPNLGQESPVVESEKPALESRIWYRYPNEGFYTDVQAASGASDKPTMVARVVDTSGTTQAWQYQYNNTLNPAAVTAMIDPLNRQTNYSYDTTTGIDLTGVTQNNGTGTDTLSTITYNNSINPPHVPATVTDAAGQTTSYTYNSQGQILTVTPPIRSGHSAEATTYTYTSNYLTSITGPLTGATKTMTYDTLNSHTVNRVKTVADAESYTLTYSYDNLDRVTQILYPDSTTETSSYLNPTTSAVDLDLHSSTDRLSRTTTRVYDSVRHMISITDPLSRTTHYHYCSCGSMDQLTDAKGNITYFNRDVESRMTSKVYPGGTQPPATPDYTYDSVGRVLTFTDKRGDVATYSYNLDNTVSGVSYSLVTGTVAPPTMSYGYDTPYNRLTSADGVSLTYYAAGSLGALKPHMVTNTLTGGSAAITYSYDEWGRVVGRNIDSANNETTTFDSLGRVTNVLNLLAPTTPGFAYAYFDPTHPTSRVGTISYPNGQSTVYNYFGNTGDERLSEIKNLNPSTTVLSQNDYTYNAVGTIATWKQQTDSSTSLLWTEGYDTADQLTSAALTNTAITSPAVRSDSYNYDLAGNPTTINIGTVLRSPSYNALNQLTGSTPSGNQTVRFTGSLNGAATVTVNGSAATVNGSNYFSGSATLAPGTTTTVPVVATDAHGNSRTNHYQAIVPAEPSYSPTFDADGNELTNGAGQTYTWDANNELASITYTGGASTLFTYDALGHRIKIVEKNSGGTVTSTKQLVWNGANIAEERDASNTVTKRFFAQGEQISGANYYYTRDHLGSVREVTSLLTFVARYNYDPYGRTTLVSGTNLSDFQYAGYYAHQPSGLSLTVFRAYDPNTARWLSRDPLGEGVGSNLYGYVSNNPVNFYDPFGLAAVITYGNGTTATTSTASGFSSAANAAAANGGISDIDVDGHADADTQTFGTTASDATASGSQIALGPDGQAYLESSPNDPNKQLLSDVLKGKLNSGAKIHLDGCDAGAGNNNIAQAVSKGTGAETYASPTPVLGRGNNGPSYAPEGWNVYVNGVNVGSVAGIGGM
jgi:RHS repeat-associated protein